MGITFAGQAGFLLTAGLLGIVLGAVFDLFRVFRVFFRSKGVAVFFQDILFWLICAVATFLFLLMLNHAKIRVAALLSEALGAALYYNTVGVIVERRVKAADAGVRRRTRAAAAAVMRPVRKFGRAAGHKLGKGGRRTGSFLKKENKLLQIRLKVHRTMMYNLLRPTKRTDDSKK